MGTLTTCSLLGYIRKQKRNRFRETPRRLPKCILKVLGQGCRNKNLRCSRKQNWKRGCSHLQVENKGQRRSAILLHSPRLEWKNILISTAVSWLSHWAFGKGTWSGQDCVCLTHKPLKTPPFARTTFKHCTLRGWAGFEGTLELLWFQTPALGRDTFYSTIETLVSNSGLTKAQIKTMSRFGFGLLPQNLNQDPRHECK